ncbi:MAG: HepT-like ribonuclease domain-containing protein [Candidatus Aenigmatarchaeota archaeon]
MRQELTCKFVQVIIDLSNLIISKKGLKVPSTYKETVKILKENKILKNKQTI